MYNNIKSILINNLHIDESLIDLDSKLVGDLNLDSLDFYELITIIETDYNIEINEDDINQIIRISDLIDYLKQKKTLNETFSESV